jgi:hypothetical protein
MMCLANQFVEDEMIARLHRFVGRGSLAAALGFLSLAAVPARGNIMLFTTASDFTGWTSGNATPAVSTSYDADGVTINGAGNNPGNSGGSINVGGASPGASMQLTDNSTLGYSILASSAGEAYSQAFMSAVDPGSIAAYSPASGFGNGTLVPVSGTITMTYTAPNFVPGTSGAYFQFGVFFNDQQDGYYHPLLSSSTVDDGIIDGVDTFTATIPYSFNGGTFNNLNMSIFSNSNETLASPIYVDSIQVVTAPVPEPASAAGIMMAAGVLLKRRRKAV